MMYYIMIFSRHLFWVFLDNRESSPSICTTFSFTAIVAINQLPITPDTLWLRVLGKGGTQRQAVEELANLPESHPFRDSLLEILAS
jgi:hypothetical protein